MTDRSSKFHHDWTLESANYKHQRLLLAFYLHLNIGFTLLDELFYVIGDRVGEDCWESPLGLLPLFLWMKCVNDYFNLNYSSCQKIAVWDK